MREIVVAKDKDELNALAAAKFVEIANSAITDQRAVYRCPGRGLDAQVALPPAGGRRIQRQDRLA